MNKTKSNDTLPKKNPPGNRTPASTDYKDPTGSNEIPGKPKNSGYDEKQPNSD